MKKDLKKYNKAQSAIEYMVLLGAITAVALAGFSTLLPQAKEMGMGLFNQTANELLGPPASDDGKARTSKGADAYP